MSRRRSTFTPKRHYSAEKITAVLKQLIADPETTFPRGAEKTFFLSPNVKYGFAVYHMYIYTDKRNDLRKRRMDVFATLGSTFSPDLDCIPEEIDTLTTNIRELIKDNDRFQGLESNLTDVNPGQEHRKPILIIQPNWSTQENGGYVLLRDLFSSGEALNNPSQLILEILSSLSYSEAAGLSIDDLKGDNILVTGLGKDPWQIKLIDLGPMDYRFFDTFMQSCAYADPRQWEKLRVAYLIHQITSEPARRDDLTKHRRAIKARAGHEYQFDVLKHWAEHRTPVNNSSHEAIIDLLCKSGLTAEPEQVASYPQVIDTWIDTYTTDSGLTLNDIKTMKQMIMTTCQEYIAARRERALHRLSMHQSATQNGEQNRPASKSVARAQLRLSTLLNAESESPNPANLSNSIIDTSQDEATVSTAEIKALIKKTIDFRESIRRQETREKLLKLRLDMGEELNTLLTLIYHNSPNPQISPFTVEGFETRLQEIAREYFQLDIVARQLALQNECPGIPKTPVTHNKSAKAEDTLDNHAREITTHFRTLKRLFTQTYLRERVGTATAAAACLLIGVGGLTAGVYLFLQSSTIPAITITIMAISALLMLISAAPIVIACKRHPSRFFEDARALKASSQIKLIEQQYA